MIFPEPIQNLINALSCLPGVGPKTASRLTFFLLRAPDDLSRDLAEALSSLKSGTTHCNTCFNITSAGRSECEICSSETRDRDLLCVVEEPLDVIALERTGGYLGRYHVLHGALSPIEGIGPDDLTANWSRVCMPAKAKKSSWRPIPVWKAITRPPICGNS